MIGDELFSFLTVLQVFIFIVELLMDCVEDQSFPA